MARGIFEILLTIGCSWVLVQLAPRSVVQASVVASTLAEGPRVTSGETAVHPARLAAIKSAGA